MNQFVSIVFLKFETLKIKLYIYLLTQEAIFKKKKQNKNKLFLKLKYCQFAVYAYGNNIDFIKIRLYYKYYTVTYCFHLMYFAHLALKI